MRVKQKTRISPRTGLVQNHAISPKFEPHERLPINTRAMVEDMAARMILLRIAERGNALTYLEFAQELNRVLFTNKFTRHTVSGVLGRLQAQEMAKKPEETLLFSSLVVLKKTGMPADGYFLYAQRCGHYKPAAWANQIEFWLHEINKCFRHAQASTVKDEVIIGKAFNYTQVTHSTDHLMLEHM
jgi:hypothetical protein